MFFLVKKYLKKIQIKIFFMVHGLLDKLIYFLEKSLYGETFHDLEKEKYLLLEQNRLLKDENDYLKAALYYARRGGR